METAHSAGPLTITRVPLDSLHLDPSNARQHGERNLEAIRSSLARFGQAEPLVIHKATRRVIGGNGRLVAMKALGWSECDVIELEVDDVTATALGIALNRTGELAEWDLPALGKLLDSLRAEQAFEGLGFSEDELDELLADLAADTEGNEVDDPGPGEPPEKPTSRTGDLWMLGENRLLCGDSTKAEDVAQLMDGETAALLSSDPPYCVRYTGMDRPIHDGKPSGKDWTHVYREIDIADLGEFLDGVFTATLPHIAEGTAIYIWHAHVQQPTVAAAFDLFGRALVEERPVAPHAFHKYDNEGRRLATGLFSSIANIVAGTDDPTTETSNRLALSETASDELGRPWKSIRHKIDESDGSSDDTLEVLLTWRDAAGRVTKRDGEQLAKNFYDDLGRVTHRFVLASDNDTVYADTDDVSGDIVLEEHQTTYETDSSEVIMCWVKRNSCRYV